MAKHGGNQKLLADSKYLQAQLRYYEMDASQLDMAKTDAEISLELYRQLSEPDGCANAESLLAAIALGQGDEDVAGDHAAQSRYYLDKLSLESRSKHPATARIHLLQAALAAGDLNLMRAELEKSREVFKLLRDDGGMARVHKNLALVYWAMGAPEQQVAEHFTLAALYFDRCGSLHGKVSTWVRMGAYYTDLYKHNPSGNHYFTQAVACLKQAESIFPDFEVFSQLGVTYHLKASVLAAEGSGFDLYRDSVNAYYEKALEMAVHLENDAQLDSLVHNIASICLSNDDCANWLLLVSEARKEVADKRRTDLLEARNEMAQFAEGQSQLRRRNQWIAAALMVFAVAAVFVFLYFQIRVRSLNRILQAQLKMLQARLNPHFIANCMNAIDSLIGQQRLREASDYIVKFTRLCRNLLDQSDDTTVSVAKEMETLGYYLDLEKLRLGDKLNYALHTDPAIAAATTRIPLMLVQPFVENAIWHGIQPKGEPGTVRVAMERMPGNRIRLIVEDDGIGREQSKLLQSQSNREHRSWGMDIARQRIEAIRHIRGAAFDLEDLKTSGDLPAGTRVTILLPMLTA